MVTAATMEGAELLLTYSGWTIFTTIRYTQFKSSHVHVGINDARRRIFSLHRASHSPVSIQFYEYETLTPTFSVTFTKQPRPNLPSFLW